MSTDAMSARRPTARHYAGICIFHLQYELDRAARERVELAVAFVDVGGLDDWLG
jgi:hypothetical protein